MLQRHVPEQEGPIPKRRKAILDFHSKPTPMQRSVADARIDAERLRNDLPHVIQVYARDWDKVILADYIKELEQTIANLRTWIT
jgi:hypothetical protein